MRKQGENEKAKNNARMLFDIVHCKLTLSSLFHASIWHVQQVN